MKILLDENLPDDLRYLATKNSGSHWLRVDAAAAYPGAAPDAEVPTSSAKRSNRMRMS